VVVLAIVAVLGAAAAAVFAIGGGGGAPVAVPSLVGLARSSAADQATSAGLLMRVSERKTADDPSGLIIEQHPAPGEHLGKGASIDVVISRGPPPVAVPVVAGQSMADATAALQHAGFVVSVVRQNDETVAKDVALGTTPAAAVKVKPETTVKLMVSDGPAPIAVPDVSGKTYEVAAQLLTAARFQPVHREVFSSTVASGTTVGSDPAAGTKAPRDSQVAVLVSKGPEMVSVPNTIGMTIDAASQALTAAGLNADVQNYQAGRHVRAQDPSAGTSVKKGSTVTLFFL
jgi:serine/threonine-protein kinase